MIQKIFIAALKKETPNLKKFYHTGVGKINAAIKLMELINLYNPKKIINYGTVGSLNKSLNGLIKCTIFKQRDMDVRPLGFKVGETPYDDINDISLGRPGLSCGTGDNFVSSTQNIDTDLFDMEAYAIAKFCLLNKLEFHCYKFVSDNANDEAAEDWKNNVSKGAKEFKQLIG